MSATFTDILAASKPRQHTVQVCVRGDLVDDQRRLEEQLEQTRRDDNTKNRKPQAPTVARKIEALQKEAEKHTYTFVFQAIGQRKWNDLIAKHPATPDQKKQAKSINVQLDFNMETFPVAAIAASCVEPQMTEEDVWSLFDAWNFSQWQKLWSGCLEANVGDTSVPKSASASLLLGRTSMKSKQASGSESLAVSSSDE